MCNLCAPCRRCLPPTHYPGEWASLQTSPIVYTHFDAALPEGWEELFLRVIADVFRILGGGFEFHAFVTHTHMQSPDAITKDAKDVLGHAAELLGHPAQPGDYTSFARHNLNRLIFLQYDTISPAHRRSVIAHEYLHVHQLTLQYDCSMVDLPMWLVEGSAALFEHLYINEYWPQLAEDGLRNAVEHTHHSCEEGSRCWCATGSPRLGSFNTEKETYAAASCNYFHETCACLFLVAECSLWHRLYVVFTQFWAEVRIDRNWQDTFERLFGVSPNEFYKTLSTFLSAPLHVKLQILPSAPVLSYACRSRCCLNQESQSWSSS